jgi:hypothetical protein
MILARHRRACWLLSLLVILSTTPICEAAAPSLVGTWQGSAPRSGCFNEKITIIITRQCGNLFQGRANRSWSNLSFPTVYFVGSIKNGTTINIHGYTSGAASQIMIMGDYQAGSPAKINVSYLSSGDVQTEYDTFSVPYAGRVRKGNMSTFYLLLSN